MRKLASVRSFLALLALVLLPNCSPDASSPSNPPLAIDPRVSVGNVRAGMTIDQVQAALGQPERKTANALEYTRLGFAVMPDRDGIVQVVMCGDVTGNNGPLVKRFTGRTKEGIGLGSTHDDLIKAYGQPATDEKFPGARESMKYDALGITFSLENGKVHHMIIRLGEPQPSEGRAVEVK